MNSRLNIATAAIFCLVLAGCASNQGSNEVAADNAAESTAAAAEQVAVNDRDDPNAIRCKRYAQTGSRLGKKVCKTNAQWDELARAAKEATDTIQREALQGRGEVGGS
ncbi:hypothetical protein DWB85_09495 [Seongchinamella sediminis]|uniref:Lipoprotein n=1 Tax=Seongchinamella sediminis TaxID=2283635 RepID=A0A3L7DX73_9GAMM|nr:hypothetical protein [Seongchinamella sediminis]RLQ22157.1 hypothetical protein DWB85_09495 [Seongchinamella sediminis]